LAFIGRFKPAGLRGLAGRAPYFHQGGAADIDALIDFYDARFNIHLSAQDHADLKAFLDSL
jgi:cytochrome c peroxidase